MQSIRRNFQKYFSHDMDTCPNFRQTHENLVDVISCHQDDVVKKLACLTNIWTHTSHKPEQLARRFVVSKGNNARLMTNGR